MNEDYNTKHRERARERLLNSKPGTIQDYELLELLLFMAIPRLDTKILAKQLIDNYGSFSKVITAEADSLLSIKGIGPNSIACFRLVKEIAERLSREEFLNKPIISSWQSLINYCRITIGHLKKEVFIVLYLDSQNQLIQQDTQDQGTIDHINIYPREVAKRALLLDASSIILVHNHPGGCTKASKEDVETTSQIVKALSSLKITVHDHIIISDKSFFSFKAEGLL